MGSGPIGMGFQQKGFFQPTARLTASYETANASISNAAFRDDQGASYDSRFSVSDLLVSSVRTSYYGPNCPGGNSNGCPPGSPVRHGNIVTRNGQPETFRPSDPNYNGVALNEDYAASIGLQPGETFYVKFPNGKLQQVTYVDTYDRQWGRDGSIDFPHALLERNGYQAGDNPAVSIYRADWRDRERRA